MCERVPLRSVHLHAVSGKCQMSACLHPIPRGVAGAGATFFFLFFSRFFEVRRSHMTINHIKLFGINEWAIGCPKNKRIEQKLALMHFHIFQVNLGPFLFFFLCEK